jgi:hypothetical protein
MIGTRVLALVPLATLVACAAGYTKDPGATPATRLATPEPRFGAPRIEVLESAPPQFEIVLTREMPTPGYRFEIDSLQVDADTGRIVAKVSEIAPEGMVAQVITPAELRLNVGSLPVGDWVLVIWTRRGNAEHRLAAALALRAT